MLVRPLARVLVLVILMALLALVMAARKGGRRGGKGKNLFPFSNAASFSLVGGTGDGHVNVLFFFRFFV